MSKRSGMSRLEDLKRGFIDIGRYRYIYHKIDMEPWSGEVCPICEQEFTEEPKMHFMSYDMHGHCSFGTDFDKWYEKWYENEYGLDDAYNALALEEEKECGG